MKRQRETTVKTPPAPKAQKVSTNLLLTALVNDATLQNTLDTDAWRQLQTLHTQYEKEGLAQRTFVDEVGTIVGTYKVRVNRPHHSSTFCP